jgi:hypothetical protein
MPRGAREEQGQKTHALQRSAPPMPHAARSHTHSYSNFPIYYSHSLVPSLPCTRSSLPTWAISARAPLTPKRPGPGPTRSGGKRARREA